MRGVNANEDLPEMSVEVVDVGHECTEGIGVSIGFAIALSALLVGRMHGGWMIAFIGLVLICCGAHRLFKIYRVKRSAVVVATVRKVWVEKYKRPGYAGVIPRFRIKVSLDAAGSSDCRNYVAFDLDNGYFDENVAVAAAKKVLASSVAYHDGLFGVFAENRIGRDVVSSAWALGASGVLLVLIGGALQLTLLS